MYVSVVYLVIMTNGYTQRLLYHLLNFADHSSKKRIMIHAYMHEFLSLFGCQRPSQMLKVVEVRRIVQSMFLKRCLLG
jgi:hypothetical protein